MARNIVWPFACFSTQRIELPHRDQIHGSGLLACRACMFFFLFFFPLSYVCFYFLKKEGKEEKSTLLENYLCYTGSFSITNWKAILQKYSHFSSLIQLIEGLS